MSRADPRLTRVIEASHGTGGKMTHDLVEQIFLPAFRNPRLEPLLDGSVLELAGMRLCLTTDSYVVQPLRFPGGSIGDLAVNGTVNDLLMCGATPVALTAAFILSEGLELGLLRDVVEDMARAARRAGVEIVTGDTKVAGAGDREGLFITTAGLGVVPAGIAWAPGRIRPGDRILLSGSVGDHGASVMASRFGIALDTEIPSDTCALRDAVLAVRDLPGVRCLRDPTRGGLATTLAELSAQSGLTLTAEERRIPVREDVRGLCEVLGLDPLYVASEGRLVAVVAPEDADEALRRLRAVPETREAVLIGGVTQDRPGHANLRTLLGAVRPLDLLPVEQLPRIC